jgi:DNA-binding CsgD family transcriptional regulator
VVLTGRRERTREAIERLCLSPIDERKLRAQLLDQIQKVLPFDAYVWLLTDPASCVGSAPLAEVPCLPELPALIRRKYLTTVNRWTELRRGREPVGLLQLGTSGQPTHSLLWREMLCDLGITDIASLVFADRYGCWGFLDLWRRGEPYTAADANWLAGISSTITQALRRRQASAFAHPASISRPPDGPAVLILDDQLRIVSRTAAATDWLRSLLPTPQGSSPIPAIAYNVAAQLLAAEAGVDPHPPSVRSRVAGGTWVTLRASRLQVESDLGFIAAAEPVGPPSNPTSDGRRVRGAGLIAVSIEETTAGPRLDLFARAHGLSDREGQVLTLLSRAADTRDIAVEMAITEYTVQDHLKSIFQKTSCAGRNALLWSAIGPHREIGSAEATGV